MMKTSDVNKATTPKAKAKATYLKAKNTTFSQHLYPTINILRSNLQSLVFTPNQSVFQQYHHSQDLIK